MVYLGLRIPTYLEKNLALLASNFPENQVVLLSDCPSEIRRLSSKFPHIKFIEVANPEIAWVETLRQSEYSSSFRENFWVKTLARFYSIFEYMQTQPEFPILHIEADVWLSPNFPMNSFQGIVELLAYPLTNFDQGVASTVFVKNLRAAKLLKGFSEECMREDSATTDVSVLGKLYLKYPDDILILPTAPSAQHEFHDCANLSTRLKLSENFHRFSGLFDASTWGQYITGEDPRNNIGKKLVYHHQLHHSVCPRVSKFNFSEVSGLTATTNADEFEIFSLHIHSKNSNIFDLSNGYKELDKYCTSYKGIEVVEFSISIFLKQITPYLNYRMRRIVQKLIRGNH